MKIVAVLLCLAVSVNAAAKSSSLELNDRGFLLARDGCTTMAVGPKASVDGATHVTHTADCADCDFRLSRTPARVHKSGDMRPIYPVRLQYPRYVGFDRGDAYHPSRLMQGFYPWDVSKPLGYIPQVERTYGYLDAIYGVMNEKQLAIGEATCGARYTSTPVHEGGKAMLDVSELSRIAMERCHSARCAIKTMGELAVSFGYYGAFWGNGSAASSGEALTVADTKEVWVFHITADDTGASAIWAAQRVPDDHIAVVANGFTIRKLHLEDSERYMASPNIYDVAKRNNLWNEAMGALDFAATYGMPVTVWHEEYIARRWWRVLSTAAPSLGLQGNMTSWQLPFSVKPDKLISAQDLIALNRDHFEGTPYDMTKGLQAGPYGNPNRYDMYQDDTREIPKDLIGKGHFERPISMFRTSYSFVSESRGFLPDIIGGRVWFGQHAPHSTVYIPLYAASSSVPMPYQTGSLLALSQESSWWAFCAVENYAERMFMHIIPDIQAEYRQLEAQEQADTALLEKRVMEVLSSSATQGAGDLGELQNVAKGMIDDYTKANAVKIVNHWWRLFFRLITKYRDGYQVVDTSTPTITINKLFYPKAWLQSIDWWHQPDTDLAAKEPFPDIGQVNPPYIPAALDDFGTPSSLLSDPAVTSRAQHRVARLNPHASVVIGQFPAFSPASMAAVPSAVPNPSASTTGQWSTFSLTAGLLVVGALAFFGGMTFERKRRPPVDYETVD